MRVGVCIGLAGGLFLAAAGGAAATEGKTVECSETKLKFEAPGYEVTCKDYTRNSVSVESLSITEKIQSLHAFSKSEQAFLDVIDDHILGSSSVFFHRTSMESDFTRRYDANFTGWAREDEVDGFEINHVNVQFENDDPVECVAFRKLGARRYEGIGGFTLGLSCSYNGSEQSHHVMKQYLDQR